MTADVTPITHNTTPFWHGGVPGLRPGDLLEPGHQRKQHEGCLWCAARARGEAHLGMDGPSQLAAVYFTENRLYAKFHASLYGYGDLYRVTPVDEHGNPVQELTPSLEDSIPSYAAPRARVVSVYERAVRLTDTERRRLDRDWKFWDDLRDTLQRLHGLEAAK